MKKTTVCVYDSLDDALEAMHLLEKNLIPKSQIKILEGHEKIAEAVRYKFSGTLSWIGLLISVAVGVTLGVLSGIDLIHIPVFNRFYEGGWLLGGIAGANIGLIIGGIITFLVMWGLSKIRFANFKAHLLKGRFLLIIRGNRLEAQLAKEIIMSHGKQFSINQIDS